MNSGKHKNSVVPGCGFHHVAIRSAGFDRSFEFYTIGLGFAPTLSWGEFPRRACMLDTGDGNYLEIFERDALPGPPSEDCAILHLCFRTDDCAGTVERARLAGAQVTVEPRVPEVFTALGLATRIAFIKGPDGEVCEFFECDVL